MIIRLCRQAGKNHPREWLEFRESHTDYEWALQIAAAVVEQFGEPRADKRAAINTRAIAIASNPNVTDEWLETAFTQATNYTGDDIEDPDQLEFNQEALARVQQKP